MAEFIFGKMEGATHNLQSCDPDQVQTRETIFMDCIAMTGLLGSASAQQGGRSAKTADRVIHFLVDLACAGVATNTFPSDNESEVNLHAFEAAGFPGVAISLSVQAASAVGTVLSSESGSKLWTQRLTHLASKRIQQHLNETIDVSVGILATVSHVICCSSIRTIPLAQLELFAKVVVRGLAPQFTSSLAAPDAVDVLKLTLASIVKLLSVVPSAMKDLAYPIVTGSKRSYAAADSFDAGSGLACKLLALQTLQAATHIVGVSPILLDAKAPVVSILGAAMNHPSSVLRQAAVEVRNTWHLLD
jgi:hypothetical protein